ncbi:hypothetical protein NEOLEDRAFT_1171126 [Neolentinus lepideus HHB14362 ss-1]|uniref:F-box domain-containing protein n=1 Tax=Neolentinus lepideus HHB14362 ss-1 TaxID=1314782 RepID=A0A165QTA3_9AGAM|nr:hypothetical protein NEOLEDRAFT_1171126 [Neolentinus lepideus HHB14362 ss-1]
MHAPLPPEILSRIVYFTAGPTLLALCRSCKALLGPVQAKLYSTLQLGEPHQCFSVCSILATSPHLAQLVKCLWIYVDTRRTQHRSALPHQYWLAVRRALEQMSELQSLVFFDSTLQSTWVIDPANIPFHLIDAKIKLRWDFTLARFLENQKSLQQLHIVDHPEPPDTPTLASEALKELTVFEGPAFVAVHLINSPITHIQACIGPPYERTLPQLLACIPSWTALRALNLLNMPEGPNADEFASEAINLIATYAPKLLHLGTLPLPCKNRGTYHRALSRLHYLRVFEVELHMWSPQPPVNMQRSLASELRIYCPSLEMVAMWLPQNRRFNWHVDPETGDWSYYLQQGQQDSLWRMP